jgi:hypothetical protein
MSTDNRPTQTAIRKRRDANGCVAWFRATEPFRTAPGQACTPHCVCAREVRQRAALTEIHAEEKRLSLT